MSAFDADRVRIELCDSISIDADTLKLKHQQAAEIWVSDSNGKILRIRKPAVVLVDDTRAGVLRQIADWIALKEDPSLEILALAVKAGETDV